MLAIGTWRSLLSTGASRRLSCKICSKYWYRVKGFLTIFQSFKFKTTLGQFKTTLGQLWEYVEATWRQPWDNFDTTLSQLFRHFWDNFATTWWLLMIYGRSYICPVGSLWPFLAQRFFETGHWALAPNGLELEESMQIFESSIFCNFDGGIQQRWDSTGWRWWLLDCECDA